MHSMWNQAPFQSWQQGLFKFLNQNFHLESVCNVVKILFLLANQPSQNVKTDSALKAICFVMDTKIVKMEAMR